jgi:phospholipid/cholesterol/gamma-HCH transport system permease protein
MANDLKRIAGAPLRVLDELGEQGWLYIRSIGWAGRTIRRYKKEVLRILTEVTFGAGGLALVGGTVIIVALLTSFTGSVVGLQVYSGLNQLGASAFTAFIAAYFNTREISPLVAAIGLTATVGAGFTAQLGAMRISEEIDALEVMAVPSLPFLMTTRLIAGFVAIIPLYAGGLLASYVASRLTVSLFYGQSLGTYDHYFNLFLPPIDILYSFFKVLVTSVLIILIHCYYGYTASGGPAGVGVAVGRSVRASLVLIFVIDIAVSLALWGSTTTVKIA